MALGAMQSLVLIDSAFRNLVVSSDQLACYIIGNT